MNSTLNPLSEKFDKFLTNLCFPLSASAIQDGIFMDLFLFLSVKDCEYTRKNPDTKQDRLQILTHPIQILRPRLQLQETFLQVSLNIRHIS